MQMSRISRSLYRCCLNSLFAIKGLCDKFLLHVKHKTDFFCFPAAKIASCAHRADTNKGHFQGEWIWETNESLELNSKVYLSFKSMNDNTYLKWISKLSNSVRSDSSQYTISYVSNLECFPITAQSLLDSDTRISYVPYWIDSNYCMMIVTSLLCLKEQEKENILCSTYMWVMIDFKHWNSGSWSHGTFE